MKKLNLLFLILYICFSCDNDSGKINPQSNDQEVVWDETEIENLLEDFIPMFEGMSARNSEVEFISVNLVADKQTGELTLLNFQEEPFFPIEDLSTVAGKALGKVYVVDWTDKNGNTTSSECSGKFSCGRLIAECLELGGCATICESPRGFQGHRNADLNFLLKRGLRLKGNFIPKLKSLPKIDISRGISRGSLVSTKIGFLIYRLLD